MFEENVKVFYRGRYVWIVIEGRLNICYMDKKGYFWVKIRKFFLNSYFVFGKEFCDIFFGD